MTVAELEDALIEFVAQNTSDFRFRSNETTDELTCPSVYSGYVARDEVGAIIPGEISTYPAIILSAQSGIGDYASEIVTVALIIGCFDAQLDQQGYRDCVNVVQRLKDRFREVSIIGESFAWRAPINWQIARRQHPDSMNAFPYFFAEMTLNFELDVTTSQFDVSIGDGDVTPGRYNALPIPTPEPNEHWKHPTPPPIKWEEHDNYPKSSP